MKDVSVIKTKDFYIACVLRALGFPLSSLERTQRNLAIFVFEDKDSKAPEVISGYWDKKISIDARSFVEAINELKTRIYSHQ